MAEIYKKGMELSHKDTKAKILFGKWNEDGTALCLTKSKQFVTLSKADLETNYVNLKLLNKQAREKRRGQAW